MRYISIVDIVFVKAARKELETAPRTIIENVLSLLEELAAGKSIGMPISRPLPGIAKGLHELRLSDRSGQYRVFYVIRVVDAIYIVHVAHKKTQKTSRQTIDLLTTRLKGITS